MVHNSISYSRAVDDQLYIELTDALPAECLELNFLFCHINGGCRCTDSSEKATYNTADGYECKGIALGVGPVHSIAAWMAIG